MVSSIATDIFKFNINHCRLFNVKSIFFTYKQFYFKPFKPNHLYLIYLYKDDLAFNNLQQVDMPLNPIKPNLIYLIYMYKEDLALNNPQSLICFKTKPC